MCLYDASLMPLWSFGHIHTPHRTRSALRFHLWPQWEDLNSGPCVTVDSRYRLRHERIRNPSGKVTGGRGRGRRRWHSWALPRLRSDCSFFSWRCAECCPGCFRLKELSRNTSWRYRGRVGRLEIQECDTWKLRSVWQPGALQARGRGHRNACPKTRAHAHSGDVDGRGASLAVAVRSGHSRDLQF